MPAISLPGHVAPPVVYDGPEFPVRQLQPLPHSRPAQQSSDEMASRVKQADVLQREVIDWLAHCVVFRISSNSSVRAVLCSNDDVFVSHV